MKQAAPLLIAGLIALACQTVMAQTSDPLKSAVQNAITSNPEVTAKLNAFRAAVDDVDVARGAYYPRLDLSADANRIRERFGNSVANQDMNSSGITLTATQLLWDGFATMNQVDRLGHTRLLRYFEFLDTTEQVALESVRAYIDVVRTRRLVKLAEDNYVQHKHVLQLLQSRVKAGVGRGVDMEQAAARLALAESNLATETSNLHDVTERYRRIVGALPGADMPLDSAALDRNLPTSAASLLDQTAKRNAAIAAAVENLRAAQSQSREREGNLYQPRLEARVRAAAGNNLDGTLDLKRDTRAGLALNWNLYNGGSDKARLRQAANLLNQATDTRDKACRDARQVAAIAFHDVQKLTEQLNYLDRHVLSSEKVRDAYRQQFDISQRTMLDLLNSENELYSARRAYANAEWDLAVAKARTYAASTSLVAALGLTRSGTPEDDVQEARYWQAGEEAATRCPLSVTELAITPKSELDARAQQQTAMVASSANPVAARAAVAAPAVPTPTAAAAVPAKTDASAAAGSTPVSQRLLDWVGAWSSKDVTRYLSFYDASFKPAGKVSRETWFDNRSKLLRKDGPVDLKIANVQRKAVTADTVETKFEQHYSSKDMNSKVQKTLTWKRRGNEWYIVKEVSQ